MHTMPTGQPIAANDLDSSKQQHEREIPKVSDSIKKEKLVLATAYLGQGLFKVLVHGITKDGQTTASNTSFQLIGIYCKPWRAALTDSFLKGKNSLLLGVGKIADWFSPAKLVTVRNNAIHKRLQVVLRCPVSTDTLNCKPEASR